MNEINFLSCRCNLDFSENPSINFVSLNYDDDLKVKRGGQTISLKGTELDSPMPAIGDRNKAIAKLMIPQIFIMLVINFIISSIPSVFVFKGFFEFGTKFLNYVLFQLTFASTMLGAFYNLFWACYSNKKCLNYYGRINHVITSIGRVPYCKFETAKKDVDSILRNNFITSAGSHIKALPMKGEYIHRLRKCVASFDEVAQYEHEYSKRLSKITNRGSILFAVICLILSFAIQVFSFISVWDSVGPDFHTNMVVIAVALGIFIPLLCLSIIKSKFDGTVMELEGLYCLYSYQYLEMPYVESYPSKTVDLSDSLLMEKYQNEDFVAVFLNCYEKKSISPTFSYRDIKLGNGGKMTIYGFIDSSYYVELLKKTLQLLSNKKTGNYTVTISQNS